MKPYEDNHIRIYNQDSRDMSELPDESVDLLLTDPPYGISFMGKDWDRALPDRRIWTECLRVLKPGAFAFVMSIPRSDCQARMVIALQDAGFRVDFTPIYWAYGSGFPKATNMAKTIDKQLGIKREVVEVREVTENMARMSKDSPNKAGYPKHPRPKDNYWTGEILSNEAVSPQAKALDGSYGGFQPKPAVEVIIVAMKPLSEKTFVDQAIKNQKGITWLDDCRIPYESEEKIVPFQFKRKPEGYGYEDREDKPREINPRGRFPANLLVSDDVLNDGRIRKSGGSTTQGALNNWGDDRVINNPMKSSSGSFSRYFDLDKWWEERIKQLPKSAQRTFPFLIVPKASKSEKNRGIGVAVPRTKHGSTPRKNEAENKSPNYHPTVKPVKLMSYLITLGSREGDTVLDNFGGSGTTAAAARLLGRKCVMYEIDERYCEIAVHRLRQMVLGLTF
ncbi:hypothetical protein ES703_122394 [subsurface metagenome]